MLYRHIVLTLFTRKKRTTDKFIFLLFLICFDMLPFVYLAMGKLVKFHYMMCVVYMFSSLALLLYGWLIDSVVILYYMPII